MREPLDQAKTDAGEALRCRGFGIAAVFPRVGMRFGAFFRMGMAAGTRGAFVGLEHALLAQGE